MTRWKVDPLLTDIHELLYRLGLKASIQGFFETSCAVFLVMQQPRGSWFSIMEVYRKISILYHVDFGAVDPLIRRSIVRIWKRNPELLCCLAGERLRTRPTPRQFIEIMRGYLILRER